MKKVNSNKLSLNRETLVTLSPDALEGVNGGTSATVPRLVTRYLCPRISQLVCPPTGGTKPQAGGQGGEQ